MNALYSLILASGTKEALFAALWLALDEAPGTFADVDFASLRTTAARFGVALSESQIRKRVKELEKLDVLAVVPRRERGRFDLLVYQPAPSKVATAPKPEPATPLFDAAFGKGVESFVGDGAAPDPRYRANSVSAPVGRDALAQLRATSDSVADAVSETETRTESVAQSIAKPTAPIVADHLREAAKMIQTPTVAEIRDVRATSAIPAVASVAPELREPVAAPLEEINNNKYIKNKTINKPAKDFETLGEDVATNGSGNRVRAAARDGSRAVAVADVRSLVDFESPKVAAFRRVVVGDVWERTVHPDLIDRLVALAVLRVGGTNASTVKAMIRDAKAEVALWNRTDGRRGQPQIWRALTPEVKRIYENAGWVWSPTRFATEPRPEPTAPGVADHFRGFTKMIQTPTVAEVRVVRPTSTIPAVASVAPESREPVAAPLEEINNNKYIKNKTINKPAKDFGAEAQASVDARSVADVRSLVDFESPKVAAFRRLVARNVWERTIHPDLIDRIVALAVLRVGGTDAKAVESMIRDAKAEVALWNRTDGRRGQPQIWRALTPEVKRVFENAGWVWAPTRFATEPRPEPRRAAETVDA